MKKALIPAFLLLLGSTILGATVLREPLAQAAAPIASVFVSNDTSSPVPVREQNLDANGNARVHEQGTAKVDVTNSSLPIAPPAPVTGGGGWGGAAVGSPRTLQPVTAIAVQAAFNPEAAVVLLSYQGNVVSSFVAPAEDGVPRSTALAFARPIMFDKIECLGVEGGGCTVAWTGARP
jgi:hypothetical protein